MRPERSRTVGVAGEPFDLEVEASSGWNGPDLRGVWCHRELLYFLVWRDTKARFKQTALGILWVVLKPALSVLVLTAVFGRIARLPSEGVPYAVFVLSGFLPWSFFSAAVANSTGSLVANAPLLTKVYFPRIVVPLASIGSAAIDAGVTLLMLVGLCAWHGCVPPPAAFLALPAAATLALLVVAGVGLWTSALNVRFRDVGNAIPFVLSVWMFATPVVYSASMVPERWRWVVTVNPAAGVVEAFRAAVIGRPADLVSIGVAAAWGLGLLVSGALFFGAAERTFADTV